MKLYVAREWTGTGERLRKLIDKGQQPEEEEKEEEQGKKPPLN